MSNPRHSQETESLFSSDRPIANRADDRLGRRAFAEAIASAVSRWRGRDSLVIALYGPYGMGKSSIKNMVVEALGFDKGQPITVAEFNPWQFANRDQVTEAFFDQIGIALGRGTIGSQQKRKALLSRWRRYAAYLQASGDLVNVVRQPLIWIVVFAALLLVGSSIADLRIASGLFGLGLLVIAALLKWSSRFAKSVVGFLEVGAETGRRTLAEVKAELARELAALQEPMLVVVDDVDRLTPNELQEVFQLIKANADFPNLVYLVLCERQAVERNIKKLMEVSGREYLEKIIQVAFDVPLIEKPRLQKILFAGLNQLLEEDGVAARFDQTRWGNLFLGGLHAYFQTLRNVNRFLSTLSFHVSLFRGERAFEVNPIDLIALEVLRMFEPEVYRALAPSKDLLTTNAQRERGHHEEKRKVIEGLVNEASEDRRADVREIIKQLFPPAEWALGGHSYANGADEKWYRDLRVCSAEVFDRYFAFAIPEGDISQSEIDQLLAAVGDRMALRTQLRSLAEQQLLGAALDRLEAYKEEIDLQHAVPFTTAIFDIGESLPEDRAAFFSISPQMHATRIVYWYLRRERDFARKRAILRTAVNDTDGLTLPVRFISLEEQAATEGRRSGDERILDDDGLQEIKELCVGKIRAAAASGRLIENPELLGLLYRWRDWAGRDEVRAFAARLAETVTGALRLVTTFLLQSTSHGAGDYVSRQNWFIRLGDVDEFASWETLETQLHDIDVSLLSEREQRAVAAFQRAADRRRAGRPDYDPGRLGDRDDDT